MLKKLKILVGVLFAAVVCGNIAMTVHKRAQDTTPPVLTVDGEVLEVSVKAEEKAYLKGISAQDDRDGDLTDQVVVEHISQFIDDATVKITYAVFDQAGNAATVTRTIRYTDYQQPRFALSQPLKYQVGSTVTLMDRLTANDVLDGDITNKIRISSQNLNNDMEGISSITVQATNNLGDTVVLTLPVLMTFITNQTPEITLDSYLIYLEQGGDFDPEEHLEAVEDPASEVRAKKSDVEISSFVDTFKPGVYQVTYSYEGEKDIGQTLLTVVVVGEEDAA